MAFVNIFDGVFDSEDPMKYNIIHNATIDGISAAALAYNHHKNEARVSIGINDIDEDATSIYLFGVVVDKQRMMEIKDRYETIWMDNNRSSIAEFNDIHIPGDRSTGLSICEIAWKWFKKGEKACDAVKYISDFESGKMEYGDDTGWFNHGIYAEYGVNDPKNCLWSDLLSNDIESVDRIIRNGRIIEKYQSNMVPDVLSRGEYTHFGGAKAYIINMTPRVLRLLSKGIINHMQEADFILSWDCSSDGTDSWKMTCAIMSINNRIDVSMIAKKFGGDGNQKFATFSKKIPMPLKKLSGE